MSVFLRSQRVMRRKRKKKDVERRGVEVKWWRRFLPAREEQSQAQRPHPLSSSLVCTGCCSDDMAAGFGPDCRNISSVVESGIAGKDNESRREKRRRETGRQGRVVGQGWTSFMDLKPTHMHSLHCCNANIHILRLKSLIKVSTAVC